MPQIIDSEDIKNHDLNVTLDGTSSLARKTSLETSTDNVAMDPGLDAKDLDFTLSPDSDESSEVHVLEKRNFLLYSVWLIVLKWNIPQFVFNYAQTRIENAQFYAICGVFHRHCAHVWSCYVGISYYCFYQSL